MNSFESMSEKLSKTGLYSTTAGNMVYAELMAYAEGLDVYYNALDELLRECFVSTAQTYGLKMREDYIEKTINGSTLDDRRKSIIAALSINCTDFTKKGFQKCLDIWGISGELTEDFENGKFIFKCTSDVDENKLDEIKSQMQEFLPCHYDFEWQNKTE